MSTLFVGIDVSKDLSTAQGIDSRGNSKFSIEFTMNAEGFSKLLKTIRKHCQSLTKTTVAMESTGCYHINLFSFLTYKGIQCMVINPLLITNFARLSLRKTKTDRKDAGTIAQFLRVHKDSLSQMMFSENIQDLRDLARERESLVSMLCGLKNDIRRILQITLPELESICNIFSETILTLLTQFPSARLIRTAKPEAIADALIHKDRRKRTSVTSEKIIQAANASVASNSTAKELILPEKISTLLYLAHKRDNITKVLVKTCESMMVEELNIITSVDGISNKSGSLFLAEVGDYRAFQSYKNLIAFAGLDPSIHQSGKFEGASRISKRGNRYLRHIIYNMTFCAVRCNNVFKEYFNKRKKEGLPFKKALIATAHKLVRVLFTMLSTKSVYKTKNA